MNVSTMSERLESKADIYAQQAEAKATEELKDISLEDLQKQFVALSGMVAYYTRLSLDAGRLRMNHEVVKRIMKELRADILMQQVEEAYARGVEIDGSARVPAKPLYELLSMVRSTLP